MGWSTAAAMGAGKERWPARAGPSRPAHPTTTSTPSRRDPPPWASPMSNSRTLASMPASRRPLKGASAPGTPSICVGRQAGGAGGVWCVCAACQHVVRALQLAERGTQSPKKQEGKHADKPGRKQAGRGGGRGERRTSVLCSSSKRRPSPSSRYSLMNPSAAAGAESGGTAAHEHAWAASSTWLHRPLSKQQQAKAASGGSSSSRQTSEQESSERASSKQASKRSLLHSLG